MDKNPPSHTRDPVAGALPGLRNFSLVLGGPLTLPGHWFTWVSNPILQFLMLRWIYRIAIWARFLWQVSRIQFDLIPTHPDRNGGLGFLGGSAFAFSPWHFRKSMLCFPLLRAAIRRFLRVGSITHSG